MIFKKKKNDSSKRRNKIQIYDSLLNVIRLMQKFLY